MGLMLMLSTLPMDMDLATLPTPGLHMEDILPILDLSMEDTLPILDLSLEDFLVTMARERLMLNQRLKLKLMLSTLLMDMDLAILPILGLPMEDSLVTMAKERLMLNQRLKLMLSTMPMDMDLDTMPTPGLHMEDTLPIQDLSMEDTLPIQDQLFPAMDMFQLTTTDKPLEDILTTLEVSTK